MKKEKSFAEQIDEVILGKANQFNDIKVCDTPNILLDVGCKQLPMLYTQKHLKAAIQQKDLKTHRHGLTVEQIKSLPDKLSVPVMLLDSISRKDSMIAVLDDVDLENNPIIVTIRPNGQGLYELETQNSNFITSIYGRENFEKFIQRAIDSDNILYYSKEKSQKLFSLLGLQFPKCLNNLDSDIIIHKSRNIVNTNNINLNKNSQISKEDNVMTEQEMLMQIENLRRDFERRFAEIDNKFSALEQNVDIVGKFVAAISTSQSFEQTMEHIGSVTKQLTDCESVEFHCFNSKSNKFLDNFNSNILSNFDDKPYQYTTTYKGEHMNAVDIPVYSSGGEAVGVIEAFKHDGFDLDKLSPFNAGGQIANTITLAVNKELEHQGRITDELTGLQNRQGMNEYIVNTIKDRINDNKPVNIVMCDIDHFKAVNDTYGHDAGDVVLKDVAAILREGTRTSNNIDCAFRFGGEEMILILNCEPDEAFKAAERLREAVENSVHTVTNQNGEKEDISVTISMGVHQINPELTMTAENARNVFDSEFTKADGLVYESKETGRNKVSAEKDIVNSFVAEKIINAVLETSMPEYGDAERIKYLLPESYTSVKDDINKLLNENTMDSLQQVTDLINDSKNTVIESVGTFIDVHGAYKAAETVLEKYFPQIKQQEAQTEVSVTEATDKKADEKQTKPIDFDVVLNNIVDGFKETVTKLMQAVAKSKGIEEHFNLDNAEISKDQKNKGGDQR